jgi:serine/threonine-protein kinase
LSSRIGVFHILRSLVTLVSLIGAFLVSAGLVIYFAYGGREVTVPELVGKSQAEAEKELSGYGLRLRITHGAPSARVAADLISEQTPVAGATVKTGQSVRVIISTGASGISESPTPAASSATARRPEATKSPTPRPKPDASRD